MLLLRGTDTAQPDAVLCADRQRLEQDLPACGGLLANHSSQVSQELPKTENFLYRQSIFLKNHLDALYLIKFFTNPYCLYSHGIIYRFCIANEGPVRIQYKCLK